MQIGINISFTDLSALLSKFISAHFVGMSKEAK